MIEPQDEFDMVGTETKGDEAEEFEMMSIRPYLDDVTKYRLHKSISLVICEQANKIVH